MKNQENQFDLGSKKLGVAPLIGGVGVEVSDKKWRSEKKSCCAVELIFKNLRGKPIPHLMPSLSAGGGFLDVLSPL